MKIEVKESPTGFAHKVLGGTWYHVETTDEMVALLETLRQTRRRVRFHWGDAQTGEDWAEENDVCGRIGRSTGMWKVPLLIHNARSIGGGAILTNCIVKITETTKPHTVIYQHPKYHAKP